MEFAGLVRRAADVLVPHSADHIGTGPTAKRPRLRGDASAVYEKDAARGRFIEKSDADL
jgi:hypothetical protein